MLKLLYRTRPYEITAGSADALYEECLADLCGVMEIPFAGPGEQMEALQDALVRCRSRFRSLPVRQEDRLLIGVVGEIFCRLNTLSNNDLVRRLEAFGAEMWMNDFSEWIWYTNWEQTQFLRLRKKVLQRELRGHVPQAPSETG